MINTPLTRTCGISGLLLVVGSPRARCCGPTRVEDGSATVAVRALGPYMALERKPEASTTRASPHRMAHTKAHPAPHEWAKVRV